MIHIPRPLALATLLAVLITSAAPAQDAPPKEGRLRIRPTPNVIDKLLAAEVALGPSLKLPTQEAWASKYRELYNQNKITFDETFLKSQDRVHLALALGIKASDGVLALKGRDEVALNECAVQIEKLAAQLGVPSQYIQRANMVKHHATQKHWIDAFTELGRLQHEITQYLEDETTDKKDDALLILLGAWLEGGQCFTSLILEHHTTASSNILREPVLVQILIDEVNGFKKENKEHVLVQSLLAFLPELKKKVDVGLQDAVQKENVEWMHKEFSRLVDSAAAPATQPRQTSPVPAVAPKPIR